MKTVIMAGGKGTRISTLFPDIPKPMIPVTDEKGVSKPVLQWEIESLKDQGFTDIIITVSHMANQIMDFFGDGQRFGVKISYYIEETPLGNAGALFKIRLDEDFLLLNADAVFDVDFNRMVKYHQSKGALATLFTHPNSHPFDSGIIIADENGAINAWLTKEEKRPQYYKNCVNAGIHILSPKVLSMSGIQEVKIGTEGLKVDLDRQLLKPLCGTRTMFSYASPEYVKDMGTPERFEQVSKDFQNGIVKARNLRNKQKAIFLDRDGTINRYVGFLRNINDFELLPGTTEAIRKINQSGYLCIVVTNQPVIARGEVTKAELNNIHNKMETELGNNGAYIDALYYCPHHPDKGYEGEIPELKIDCLCRKPKPGMILQASLDYHIDLSMSWMIGDGENDILCGQNAGCRTALIGELSFGQDITASSLLESLKKILCDS